MNFKESGSSSADDSQNKAIFSAPTPCHRAMSAVCHSWFYWLLQSILIRWMGRGKYMEFFSYLQKKFFLKN